MKVLILTSHFSPNVGGVETHLDDLVSALAGKGYNVTVLSYQPLITRIEWKMHEKNRGIEIIRIPWLAGLFYKLVRSPIVEFIYLTPGLFMVTPFVLLYSRPEVIHSHGLIAGFIAVFWGKLFRLQVITTTHSIYHFPQNGMYRKFAKWIFDSSDKVLTLSSQSALEIAKLGISKNKIHVFTYWVDLDKFKPLSKVKSKEKWGWNGKFIVLFVGRLVSEKGIAQLLDSFIHWNKNIYLAVIGTGPLNDDVKKVSRKNKNMFFLGRVDNKKLPDYYNASDLLIVPSVHEEGFGRVIIEALSCGLPVIGSKRGAIPEAMNNRVGKLIDVSPRNIKLAVENYYNNKSLLKRESREAIEFARQKYSEKNVETIIQSYK